MKNKGILLFILFIFGFSTIRGQNKVVFTYDSNGNRTSRTLVLIGLKSSDITFPVDPDKLDEKTFNNIHIYPNPFSTSIRVTINSFDDSEKKSAIIYSISGTVLKRFENITQDSDMELNDLDDGIYIMRLFVGSKIFNYKLIKSK